MNRSLHKILPSAFLCTLALSLPIEAATLTEPSHVVFGKVVHLGEGSSYQVHSGTLTFQLVRDDDPTHVIQLETELGSIGPAGELSYRIEVPVGHQLEESELKESLAVDFGDLQYSVQSIRVDGVDASPLDSAQSLLSVSFANRAAEHRLDLEVSLPETDSDGDEIPDWWEEQFGLNIHLASDAAEDPDNDELDNLAEFRNGTNPNVSNTTPTVQTSTMFVPLGGVAGFYVKIVDSDTDPSGIALTIDTIPNGLTLIQDASTLSSGAATDYAAILAGRLRVRVDPSFEAGFLELSVTDSASSPVSAAIAVTAFSPASVRGLAPAVWLQAGSLSTPGPIEEWIDHSGNQRDAYQPLAPWQPVFDGELSFGGERFLFLDDRDLDTSSFTGFFAFKTDDPTAPQTLIRMGDLDLSIGGKMDPHYAGSYRITGAGRQFRGPLAQAGQINQLTVGGGSGKTFLDLWGAGLLINQAPSQSHLLPDSFSTVGAHRAIDAQDGANDVLAGTIQEILIYDRELAPATRTRNEDYQLSRWSDLTVWDFRDQTSSLELTGHPGTPNSLNSGWGSDLLNGGPLTDTLRGGPGNDHLTGGPSGDRFQIFSDHGNDVITDFDPEAGDIIDLSSIFAGLSGDPNDFVRVRLDVVRVDGALPRTDSILELDHNGATDGWSVDQTVTLQNQTLGSQHLPRLVGEGSLNLGGLIYETNVSFATAPGTVLENGLPHTITLTRTGNLDAAIDIPLSFTGTATADLDYTTSSLGGNGAGRLVRFERGESSATFDLVPVADPEIESESILITILDDPLLSSGAGGSLAFTLEDVTQFAIRTEQHVEIGPGGQLGIIVITRRSPDPDLPVSVDLDFGGSLANGSGFPPLPETVSFSAGETTKTLTITPDGDVPPGPEIDHFVVDLVSQNEHQAIAGQGSTTVFFLPPGSVYPPSLSDWLAAEFPGNGSPELPFGDPDTDLLKTIFEYIVGSDPNEPTSPALGTPRFRIENGKLEISLTTTIGWNEVTLGIEKSSDLVEWSEATSEFTLLHTLAGNNRLKRTWRTNLPAEPGSYYRLVARIIPSAP